MIHSAVRLIYSLLPFHILKGYRYGRTKRKRTVETWEQWLCILLCGLLVWAGSVSFGAGGAIAQSTSFDQENAASLYITIQHPNEVQVNFYAEQPEDAIETPLESLNERQLQNAAQSVLGCTGGEWDVSSEAGISIWGNCNASVQSDWGWQGNIDLSPLISVASELSIPYVEVTLDVPDIGESEISPPGQSWYESVSDENTEFSEMERLDSFVPNHRIYQIDTANSDVAQITYQYGFQPRRIVLDLLGLLVVMLIAIGLQVGLRIKALKAHANHPDEPIWFGYQRARAWIEAASWFFWIGAVSVSAVNHWQALFLPAGISQQWLTVLDMVWTFVPPLLLGILNQCLAFRVTEEVSELDYTRAEMMKQYLGVQGTWFCVLLMILAAPFTMSGHIAGPLVMLFAALSMLVLKSLNKELMEMTPYAMTTGELRDRVFEIAKPTGVKLRQLYLLPKQRSRILNACAVKNDTVMVTDYLLKSLSKDEVDAVMAHEIAHLQLGHPRKLLWQIIGTAIVSIWAIQLLTLMTTFIVPWATLLPVPLVFFLAGYLFYASSRRFEYQADAQAAVLTNNPQALITGLVKLARFNRMPLQWGKLGEAWMTHPSMMRRVSAIADHHDLSTDEVDTLLATAQQETPPENLYALTTIETSETPPLFSSQTQQKMSQRLGWSIVLCFSLLPVILGRVAALLPTPGLRYLGYGIAAIAVCSLYFYIVNVGGTWGFAKLQTQLATRLKAEGIDAQHGTFVGFAPHADMRLYEGCTEWDVGFLFVEGSRLCYVGEQVRFALTAAQITQVTLLIDRLEWFAQGGISITWQADDLAVHDFRLQMLSGNSVKGTVKEARSLLEKIESALQDGESGNADVSGPTQSALQTLQPLNIGNVTSQPIPAFALSPLLSLWFTRMISSSVAASLLFAPWAVFVFGFVMATVGTGFSAFAALQRAKTRTKYRQAKEH